MLRVIERLSHDLPVAARDGANVGDAFHGRVVLAGASARVAHSGNVAPEYAAD
jgi:hypothetical protein